MAVWKADNRKEISTITSPNSESILQSRINPALTHTSTGSKGTGKEKILLARQLAINLSATMTSRDSPAAAPHAALPCLQPCPALGLPPLPRRPAAACGGEVCGAGASCGNDTATPQQLCHQAVSRQNTLVRHSTSPFLTAAPWACLAPAAPHTARPAAPRPRRAGRALQDSTAARNGRAGRPPPQPAIISSLHIPGRRPRRPWQPSTCSLPPRLHNTGTVNLLTCRR